MTLQNNLIPIIAKAYRIERGKQNLLSNGECV